MPCIKPIENNENLSSAEEAYEKYIESKLDEADRLAETVTERLSHEEVFDALRKKIRE